MFQKNGDMKNGDRPHFYRFKKMRSGKNEKCGKWGLSPFFMDLVFEDSIFSL
jgi:hypothetical protein